MKRLFQFFFRPKQVIHPLDAFYYRLYNREDRLKRLLILNAPAPIIQKEEELIQKAKTAIEDRLGRIKRKVTLDRLEISQQD